MTPLETARAVMADRHKVHTVSTNQLVAICRELVEVQDRAQIPTPLAEAIEALIANPTDTDAGARIADLRRLYQEEFCP